MLGGPVVFAVGGLQMAIPKSAKIIAMVWAHSAPWSGLVGVD